MGTLGARSDIGSPLRLGELALKAGLISEVQLKRALAEQEREAKKGRLPRQLGLILLSLGFLAEGDLINLLAEQEKQRIAKGKIEALPTKTGPQEEAGPKDSRHVLKKLPTVVVRPHEGPGGRPAHWKP